MPSYSSYVWTRVRQHRGKAATGALCYEVLYVLYLLYPNRNPLGYSPAVIVLFILFNLFACIGFGVALEMLAEPLARNHRAPWALVVVLLFVVAAALHGGTGSAVQMCLMLGVPVVAAWFIDEELLPAIDLQRFMPRIKGTGLSGWHADQAAQLWSLEAHILKQHAQGEPWTNGEQGNLVQTRAAIDQLLTPYSGRDTK